MGVLPLMAAPLAGTGSVALAAPVQQTVVTDVPSTATPRVIGGQCYGSVADMMKCRKISAIAKVGGWIYAVGIIDVVGRNDGTDATAGFSNIIRFNASTKVLDKSFRPQVFRTAGQVKDGEVTGIASSADGSVIYVAGRFSKAASAPGASAVVRRGLAAFTTDTGELVDSFRPAICKGGGSCNAFDVRLIGPSLWVGGDFSKVGGFSRGALVSLDPVTGAATSAVTVAFTGRAVASTPTKITKIKENPARTKAVILGNFTAANGTTREEVAMLNVNPTTGGATTVNQWYSPASFHAAAVSCKQKHPWPRDTDWSPTGTSFVIVGTGGGGGHPYPAPCDAYTKWADDGSPNAVPLLYNHTEIDTIGSVCNVGDVSYVGGHFKSLNQDVRRNGLRFTPPRER